MNFNDFQNVGFFPTSRRQEFNFQADSSFLGTELLARCWVKEVQFIEVPKNFMTRSITGKAKGTTINAIFKSVTDIMVNWWNWGWEFRCDHVRTVKQLIWQVNEPI